MRGWEIREAGNGDFQRSEVCDGVVGWDYCLVEGLFKEEICMIVLLGCAGGWGRQRVAHDEWVSSMNSLWWGCLFWMLRIFKALVNYTTRALELQLGISRWILYTIWPKKNTVELLFYLNLAPLRLINNNLELNGYKILKRNFIVLFLSNVIHFELF